MSSSQLPKEHSGNHAAPRQAAESKHSAYGGRRSVRFDPVFRRAPRRSLRSNGTRLGREIALSSGGVVQMLVRDFMRKCLYGKHESRGRNRAAVVRPVRRPAGVGPERRRGWRHHRPRHLRRARYPELPPLESRCQPGDVGQSGDVPRHRRDSWRAEDHANPESAASSGSRCGGEARGGDVFERPDPGRRHDDGCRPPLSYEDVMSVLRGIYFPAHCQNRGLCYVSVSKDSVPG